MDIDNIFSEDEKFVMLFKENSKKEIINSIKGLNRNYASSMLLMQKRIIDDVVNMLEKNTPQELFENFVLKGFENINGSENHETN